MLDAGHEISIRSIWGRSRPLMVGGVGEDQYRVVPNGRQHANEGLAAGLIAPHFVEVIHGLSVVRVAKTCNELHFDEGAKRERRSRATIDTDVWREASQRLGRVGIGDCGGAELIDLFAFRKYRREAFNGWIVHVGLASESVFFEF